MAWGICRQPGAWCGVFGEGGLLPLQLVLAVTNADFHITPTCSVAKNRVCCSSSPQTPLPNGHGVPQELHAVCHCISRRVVCQVLTAGKMARVLPLLRFEALGPQPIASRLPPSLAFVALAFIYDLVAGLRRLGVLQQLLCVAAVDGLPLLHRRP